MSNRDEGDEIPNDTQPRKNQLYFIFKVYAICVVILVMAILQWQAITAKQKTACWLKKHKQYSLPVALIGFFSLLLYSFFYKHLLTRSRLLAAGTAVLTVELNTIILMHPMLAGTHKHILYASIATLITLLLLLIFAFIPHTARTRETEFFTIWTVRLFVITELGYSATYALRNYYLDMFFVSVMLSLYVLLFIYFSFSMSSINFMESTAADYLLFASIYYFNALGFFSLLLMFAANLQQVV